MSSLALLLVAALRVSAQTTDPATIYTAPDKSDPWRIGPIGVSGLIDGYYSLNFNHPASRTNALRNFDVKGNQFSLNMAKLTLEHDPEPVGFKLDFGVGRAFDIFHATEPSSVSLLRNLPQAYVSVKPPKANGFQLDFGKFYTSAGAELTETNLNWNYSRSFAYANGPYYHFGLRTTMPLSKHFAAGFQLLNGWNNVEDNNSGKTIGFTGAFTTSKFSWFHNYYVGPEKTDTNTNPRHFYDTVFLLTHNDHLNAYVNFDYGSDRAVTGEGNTWIALAVASKHSLSKWFFLSPRFEIYNDRNGLITGTAQHLKEFTMTADFHMADNFLTRLEYRRDWSNQPFFDLGDALANAKTQSTLLLGIVAYFGPKR